MLRAGRRRASSVELHPKLADSALALDDRLGLELTVDLSRRDHDAGAQPALEASCVGQGDGGRHEWHQEPGDQSGSPPGPRMPLDCGFSTRRRGRRRSQSETTANAPMRRPDTLSAEPKSRIRKTQGSIYMGRSPP